MNRKGIENILVVFLFLMVLVVFSLAHKDSKKLERLYKASTLIQEQAPDQRVQATSAAEPAANN
ncbi:MAG: hypothetical protein EOO14_25490 [Chitinophagaceae bacterium]|nr:MAG: hypothetical protein EOO14_25490 [Chitinophagaceae bacterium]